MDGNTILEVINLQNQYSKRYGDLDCQYIFPNWWCSVDFKVKKEILLEALKEEKSIEELEIVQAMRHNSNVSNLYEEYKQNIRK